MINFNGNIVSPEENLLINNRAFLYGDGVFETLKMLSGVQIMSELGFDNETARLTWSLQFLVEEAAYRHAEFKGLDGKDYFATINPQPSIDKVVTI